MAITVVLADDHHIVRQGLRSLLEAEEDVSVVGEAEDGLTAVELVGRLHPDVLVLDLVMPGLNGLEVIHQVVRRVPQTSVVVLSMRSSEGYVMEALRQGAMGYVLKSSGIADLIQAIREAASGQHYLSSPLSKRAIQAYVRKAKADSVLDKYETLTSREREVLQLAAEGFSNREIAGRLSLSPYTVMTHRANLIRKLDLHGQTEIVRYALQRGIISLEE